MTQKNRRLVGGYEYRTALEVIRSRSQTISKTLVQFSKAIEHPDTLRAIVEMVAMTEENAKVATDLLGYRGRPE